MEKERRGAHKKGFQRGFGGGVSTFRARWGGLLMGKKGKSFSAFPARAGGGGDNGKKKS